MSFHKELLIAASVACIDDQDGRCARVGCVIKRKDGALVMSRNLISWNKEPSRHAEARAVRKADVGSIAYVARIKRDGTLANAKPCSRCEAIMRSRGVKRAYYTLSHDEWGCIELND